MCRRVRFAAPALRWLTVATLAVAIFVPAVASAQARIVSTSPSITETLFALGLGDRVVAVSRYCRYPAEVLALPKVGTFLQPDVELIARLRPDLAIVNPGPNGIERRLSTMRIPFTTVQQGGLANVYSSIRIIGGAAGIQNRAEALVSELQARLQRVRAAVSGRAPQKVLIIVGRSPGTLTDLVAVGRGSYMSDLAAIAGGVNVLPGDMIPQYPRISMETVIRLAPDVIIDAGDMGDTPGDRRSRQVLTEGLWKQQRLAAAKSGRVHAVISDAFVVPGPRVVEATETMALWLHGISF